MAYRNLSLKDFEEISRGSPSRINTYIKICNNDKEGDYDGLLLT